MVSSVRELVTARQGIKESTRASYLALLKHVVDLQPDDRAVRDYLDTVANPNTKRATAIAMRAIGIDVKIPRGFARVYDLPDEEDLRLCWSYSKYEPQALAMMYLGLRLGEACIVSQQDCMPGNRIFISKQVAEYRLDGRRITEIREPKSIPAVIDCPPWLKEILPVKPKALTPTNVRAAMHYTSNRYLGKTVNPHALRHWCCTQMLDNGVPLPVVQRQMRHSDISTTLRTYAQFGGKRMNIFDEKR